MLFHYFELYYLHQTLLFPQRIKPFKKSNFYNSIK